jgi:hypothetical protein
MHQAIESQPAVMVMRYLIMKEIMFKVATLNRESRDFVGERLHLVKAERIMTLRMDIYNLRPRPRHIKNSWIPLCMT